MAKKSDIMLRFLGRKIQEYEALKAEIKAFKFEVQCEDWETIQKV